MWLGATDNLGRLHVTTVPGSASVEKSGILLTATGAVVHTAALLPQVFVNGIGVRHGGALCIANGGTVVSSSMGLPVDVDGRLVTQQDVVPNANDPYVAGIRVGPAGGVYTTTAAPA
jgi:hypothetical protein